MNRKQRRELEKRMGITKMKKNESRQTKFDRYHESAVSGQKQKDEMNEIRRLQENVADEQQQSNEIASRATTLMVQEGLSYVDALEKAKELIEAE